MAGVVDEILIIGGGIGGLTTALALAMQGRKIRLLERAAEIVPIGYGIQIGPNALPLFERLGVVEEVLAASHLPSALVMVDATSGELSRVPFGAQFKGQFSGLYLCIHRADLHDILLRALSRFQLVTLESNASVIGYEEKDSYVDVFTEQGRSFRGSALIAADGLNSVIRAKLHPGDQPRQTGYVAHRTVRAMSDVPAMVRRDEVILWVAGGHHIIYYPLRHKSELNIVAVFEASMADANLPKHEYKLALQRHLQDSDPEMKAVLELMDLERSWPIGDRNPIRHWSSGRVTLLGDAAHATLQSLAQGAAMAIEDAVTLAEIIGVGRVDFAAAFRQFETNRILRTARVQLESRELWEMYHARGIARDVRNRTYSGRLTDDYYRCFEWLWQPLDFRNVNAATWSISNTASAVDAS